MLGKIVTENEIDVMLVGPTRILLPDGRLLAQYVPGAFSDPLLSQVYPVLHSLRENQTANRGMASGAPATAPWEGSTWKYAKTVSSMIIGSFDPTPKYNYCRLTAWSGKEWERYSELFPLFGEISRVFAELVPDRWRSQMQRVQDVHPDWIIPGTAFTTVTVNNSYPTGVHVDKGDLDEGFSTLTCLRRGDYSGGYLTFPEYRVAVNLQHGDLLLMDAHQWHGNTAMICNSCGKRMGDRKLDSTAISKPPQDFHDTCGTERISVVSYFRTKMIGCGSAEEESVKAAAHADSENTRHSLVDEMAVEAMGG
jgi:Oxygenase domain of the 2OGFeDO superfamily